MTSASPSELARAEARPTAQSKSRLARQYSSEDVERFIRETNLCLNCRAIFGLKKFWKELEPHDRGSWFWSWATGRYEHHPSIDSLRRSAEAGCQLCIKVYNRWTTQGLNEPKKGKSTHQQPISFTLAVFNYDSHRRLWLEHADDFRYLFIDNDASSLKDYIVPIAEPESRHLLIKRWVDLCLGRRHRSCRQYRGPCAKPTRLLHLDTYDKDIVKLISVKPEKQYSYVTLSYRWGSPEPPKLSRLKDAHKQGNLSIGTLQGGVRVADLPQTFQDAMRIVQECGLEYIWIDSLCIIQDVTPDGVNSDWDTEAIKMCNIYKGGVFNIVAAGGKNSHWSLFPRQDGVLLSIVRASSDGTTDRDNKATRLVYEDPWHQVEASIMDSELISRGWVYQETLLTPANLFCTGDQLWWSCGSSTYSQAFPRGIPNEHALPPEDIWDNVFVDSFRERRMDMLELAEDSEKPTVFAWRDVIETYSRTSVTVPDDRLVALAGIARLYVRRMRSEGPGFARYHSGVWSGMAEEQLLWRIEGEPPSSLQPAQHPIPSWSPLCQQGPIKLVHPLWSKDACLVEYVNMITSGLDRFGRCRTREDGTLKLRGVLIDIGFSDDYSRLHPTAYKGYHTKIWWDNYENQKLAKADGGSSWCGLVCATSEWFPNHDHGGLLLRACDDRARPKNKGRKWQRCGYFDIDLSDYRHTKDDINAISRVFGFQKYGLKVECRSGTYGLASTNDFYELEDLYIV